MPIPEDILRQVKLMTGIRDTDRTDRMEAAYQRVVALLMQQTEWFVEYETIPGHATLSILSPQERLVRVIAVLYNRSTLDKAVSWSLDIRNRNWQADAPAPPESWFWDKIPQSLDGQIYVGAEQIAVAPPVPDPPGTFEVIEAIHPADDAVLPPWMAHLVALRLAAELLRIFVEEHEAPDPQIATAQGQFLTLVADLWQRLLTRLVPA